MQVWYTEQELPSDLSNSIFLAGPTPRNIDVKSWRPDAVEMLSELDFSGHVVVPEWSNGLFEIDDVLQFEWDRKGLEQATVIVFWVCREMETMPALTTNVEFGRYVTLTPDRVLYGRPDVAASVQYLDWLYQSHTKKEPFMSLKELLSEAVQTVLTVQKQELKVAPRKKLVYKVPKVQHYMYLKNNWGLFKKWANKISTFNPPDQQKKVEK